MVTLHPNIIKKSGKKEFVVIPYDEFLLVQEELESFEDLKALRDAKRAEGHAAGMPLSEAKRKLGTRGKQKTAL